jgi:hypothetical protein
VSWAVRSWDSCRKRAEYCFCRAMYSRSGFLVSMEGDFLAAVGLVGDESEECVWEVWFGSEDGPGDDESFGGGEDGVESMEGAVVSGADWALWSSGAGCFFNIGDLNGLDRIALDSSSRLRFAAFMMGEREQADARTMVLRYGLVLRLDVFVRECHSSTHM